jgi:hypothetical protein
MFRDIYFLNSRVLSERLHSNDISELIAFKHLLVYSILFSSRITIPMSISLSTNQSRSLWLQILSFMLFASIQFWGMNMLYKTNQKGDGKAFFLRWAALSLPVGIQVFAICLIIYGFFSVYVVSGFDLPDVSKYYWWITLEFFWLSIQFIYFKLMQKNLTICSSGPQQAVPA